jgi:hypothetical protein
MRYETIEFQARDKTIRMCDNGGVMARHYKKDMFYEPHMLEYIRTLDLKGRYLDIGANIGNHAVYFDMLCPSTSVEAFEPDRASFAILEENVRLNPLRHTSLHPVGLSDGPGTASAKLGSRTVEFETRTLDSYGFDGVMLIKVDIEGMEPAFLRGALGTLARCRPRLFIEANTDEDMAGQEAVLRPAGYARTGRQWNASPTFEWRPA